MKFLRLALLLSALCFLFGCSHHLEINNLHEYQTSSFSTLPKDLTIGVTTSSPEKDGKTLVTGMATSLSKYSSNVIYPYAPSSGKKPDIITNVAIHPKHEGSGLNFLINFPGFLVWAPAWNGYQYYPSYDINIDIVSGSDNSRIDSFKIPIKLDVNHSDIGRTWTEISWFEVGSIALISGFVFINYDDDITPMVEREIKGPIGDYLAQEIINRIRNSSIIEKIRENNNTQKDLIPSRSSDADILRENKREPNIPVVTPSRNVTSSNSDSDSEPVNKLSKIKSLYDSGLITKEEYDQKKEQILNSL